MVDKGGFNNDELIKPDFDKLINYDGFIGLFEQNTKKNLIGYIYLNKYDDLGYINRITVRKNKRGQGMGAKLFSYALDYFLDKNVNEIVLYVETKNEPALNLYQKYGFNIINESWHYIFEIEQFAKHISPTLKIESCFIKELSLDQINSLPNIFGSQCNFKELIGSYDRDISTNNKNNYYLGLYQNDELVLFARFNQSYSGCRPLHYLNLEYVDIFIELLKNHNYIEKDYLRITFDNYSDLAELFSHRNYKMHHHLYRMKKVTKN
ncbi:MAG: GNAT family N-acetyltransferase [Candidatus Thorarchaeota archaeon]